MNALGRISSSDYSLTNLPGAALEAVLNDSSTRVLQSPQIRSVDNVEGHAQDRRQGSHGDRQLPAGRGRRGRQSAGQHAVHFLDVGVNLEILPRVHDNNEVSLHVDLDVSQVKTGSNLGGVSEPEISQNKATADIRMRDGEVNLIGGIIQQTDSKSTTGIPGLASIPLLGRLFSGESTEKDRNGTGDRADPAHRARTRYHRRRT